MSELKAFRIIQGDTGGYGAPSYKCDTDGNRIEEWSDACEVYDRFEADKVIADLEESHKKEVGQLLIEIEELKQKLGAVNEFVKESKELLKESQKMHQRCADNASKQIRRLKRALYKACANRKISEGNTVNTMHETEEYAMQMYKELCHQKYKRCLAMTWWCGSEAYIHEHGSDYDEDLVAWFGKWHKRWLELADKYKEEA